MSYELLADVRSAAPFGSAIAAGTAAPELEMTVVEHLGNRRGTAVTGDPGKLPGREPGSVVPGPRLEPRIQVGELRFKTGLARVLHAIVLGVPL